MMLLLINKRVKGEDVGMKKKNWPTHSILAIAIVATWIKTYVVYHTSFDMEIENIMQQVILFINPLSFLLLIYGLSLFFKRPKARNRYIVLTSIILSIIVYANAVFYRFFTDFITIPVLFQTSNFGDLGASAAESIFLTDIFYFMDVIVIIVALKWLKVGEKFTIVKPAIRKSYFVFSAAVLFLNLGLSEIERPQLLTRSFDREVLVKNIGSYNYHLYDLYIQSKSHAQRALADGSELVEVNNFVRSSQADPTEKTFGLAEDRNLIIVSLESLQSFVINNDMNGHEITPFLNSLTADEDTFYFSNFYHQTGLGKTSDSEFLVENSLYPLGGGAVFFTHSGNTFHSMAESLNEEGYFTNVLHPNNKSFWNRDMMYKALDIQKYYDENSYIVNEENSVSWGLKDAPFFEQSVDLMAEMPQPFYSRLITLTNHYPFTLDVEDQNIPEYDSNSNTLNKYFQTVNYMDEALELFFEDLKEKGLYDNSIIVMYGDHYGISENHNNAMSQYLEKEITPFESAKLQNVPLFVHIPNSGVGEEVTEVAGQIDVRPTILHLLGIDTSKDMQLGADLFSEEHEDFVVFRDGGFVTDELVYTKNVCYDSATGVEIAVESCQPYIDRAIQELGYSDQIINGDLLRFYDLKTGNLLIEEAEKEE
ncbi:phosphoglycerol transferase MdoB-like AlkP superfamily enzyme [Psychrobacillus insolitus]|uniref:Phosphoglycerol transferase MdoB-like AlkP superfamily enzyme n=2 Tax=Psychrobacillus insolitus TaxID=1461 RepID=A0A2W7MJL6_9BACI|nr:phosphoglycerol transferase MdoB-like AlkP superfamily enzyme [Psychrobacillus insolitus]